MLFNLPHSIKEYKYIDIHDQVCTVKYKYYFLDQYKRTYKLIKENM